MLQNGVDMKFTKFVIDNYKGIKHLDLDLNILPDNKIFTLVGLNESGKTTILEAIHDFEFEVSDENKHRLIPKNVAGGFTGSVKIKATLSFSDEDKDKIRKFVLSTKTVAKDVIISDSIDFERQYDFSNSMPGKSKRTYSEFVRIKKTKRSTSCALASDMESMVWNFVKTTLFPEIIFYRDFLAKFPDKIYLSGH